MRVQVGEHENEHKEKCKQQKKRAIFRETEKERKHERGRVLAYKSTILQMTSLSHSPKLRGAISIVNTFLVHYDNI